MEYWMNIYQHKQRPIINAEAHNNRADAVAELIDYPGWWYVETFYRTDSNTGIRDLQPEADEIIQNRYEEAEHERQESQKGVFV